MNGEYTTWRNLAKSRIISTSRSRTVLCRKYLQSLDTMPQKTVFISEKCIDTLNSNVHTMVQNCWLPGYLLLKIHKLSLNLSSCITFLYNHMIFSSTLRANINTNGVSLKWWLFKDGRLRVAARIRVENVIAVLQGCFEISMYRAMWPWEDIFGYSNRMHAFFTMY